MNSSDLQEYSSLFANKLLYLGIQLILPLLTAICFVVAYYKFKRLASAGIHQSLNHISRAFLCYALYMIVPIIIAPVLIFIGGDAYENYIDITLNSVAFLFALTGTILLFKAVI